MTRDESIFSKYGHESEVAFIEKMRDARNDRIMDIRPGSRTSMLLKSDNLSFGPIRVRLVTLRKKDIEEFSGAVPGVNPSVGDEVWVLKFSPLGVLSNVPGTETAIMFVGLETLLHLLAAQKRKKLGNPILVSGATNSTLASILVNKLGFHEDTDLTKIRRVVRDVSKKSRRRTTDVYVSTTLEQLKSNREAIIEYLQLLGKRLGVEPDIPA